LLCITSVIGSCTVNVLPSQAVTFSSESFLNTFNFSATPTSVATNAETNTFTIAGVNSSIQAEAFANSVFFIPTNSLLQCIPDSSLVPTPAACNFSSARIEATGEDFLGFAEGRDRVQGSFFIGSSLVGTDETFSFNFSGFLNLESRVDLALPRRFQTVGEIVFQVYEIDPNNNLTLLDSFNLSGILNTDPSAQDSLTLSEDSEFITLNNQNFSPNFGGSEETISALFEGTYARSFTQETSLVFVSTSVSRIAVVPEPSSLLALAGLGLLLPFWNRKSNRSKITNLAK
jgi:hypothetical protein